MSELLSVWSQTIRLGEAVRFTAADPLERHLDADEAARAKIARSLDLVALGALTADLRLSGWFDGLRIDGDWRAVVTQTCGVSLERFDAELSGRIEVKVVLATSPHATVIDEPEIEVDLEADDPPDVLETDVVDLGAYVVEHLALEIDPFPRKPGVEFVPPEPTVESSPFDILKKLKSAPPEGDA